MRRIVEFLKWCRENHAFSGAAYAVGNSIGVVEQGAIGTLSWDGAPVTLDTMFDLASVTKPIVALGLMRLLEEGEFRLDDTISYFLPEYRGTDKGNVTVRQLLTHTSGVPGQQTLYHRCTSLEEMKEAVRKLPLQFTPGTDVEYSSQGFMILGWILETMTRQTLDAAVSNIVLRPLMLSDTRFNPAPEERVRIAATEYCHWRNGLVKGEVHDENASVMGGVAAHAGLFGTVADLATICVSMLRMGELETGNFLQPDTVQLMTSHHTEGLTLARGLGWQKKDTEHSPAGDLFSDASYGHTGFTGTSIWLDPVSDWFAVLLTNRVHPSRANDSIVRIRPLFHNLAAIRIGHET